MARRARFSVVLVMAVAALVVGGCKAQEAPKAQPKVSPPAVVKAGILKAGVDMKTPPFAGTDNGTKAGIDVDVAAALAERLGLTVQYVDVAPSAAATALASGKVDVVLSVPFTGSDAVQITTAGTYLSDAPAFFVANESTGSAEASVTLSSLTAGRVAAQEKSPAYWLLVEELGTDGVKAYPTLREALQALDAGEVDVVAGDAFVGSYIGRDFPKIKYAGQLAPATPLAVAVNAENTDLADAVRSALDELAADGVLDSVRSKWLGDLPQLKAPKSDEATSGD